MTDTRPDDWAHLHCEGLLRRWLAETHTPVAEGPLSLALGPIRLRTEIVYYSPTGVHRFGPVHVVDAAGRTITPAEPALVASACSRAARNRAVPEAPINTGAACLADWVVCSLATTGDQVAGDQVAGDQVAGDQVAGGRARRPTGADPSRRPAADLAALAESIEGPAQAESWLDTHLEGELVPALKNLDPGSDDVEQATASLLTARSLAVIGMLGARGVVEEHRLLRALARRLDVLAHDQPGTEWLIRHWLTSPTLTDHAVVNGSQLRYQADTGLPGPPPVPFETPNPLLATGTDERSSVPGAPVPALGAGWSLRPVDPAGADVTLVHQWMNTEHVAVQWRQAWSWSVWREEIVRQLGDAHSVPCLVDRDGRTIAYVELYRVLRDKLAGCYPYHPHDLGVHIAIGAPEETGRGQGTALLRELAEGLLAADQRCSRVVAEPDVRNTASIAAFGKAGYRCAREIGLPEKNSALMVFSRPTGNNMADAGVARVDDYRRQSG